VGLAAERALKRLGILLLLVPLGCAHGKPDLASLSSNSDRVIWEAAQKALQGSQWDSTRQLCKRIIDGFPQSEFGPEARLALAESYLKEGGTANYILAVAKYREFLTLYPSHPKSDYAQFQAAEAYFRQRNSADRDQTSTQKALEEYQRLLDIYPSSAYVEPARSRIRECRQSLAQSEFMAGYFYQKTRQAWRAACLRYEGILADYPDYDRTDEVLFRLAECLGASGRAPEALPYLNRLITDYPQSTFTEPARRLMELLAKAPVNPPPAPAPSPSASPSTLAPVPSPSPPSPTPAPSPPLPGSPPPGVPPPGGP
jgi:outer membrane protein assembly factor BamD